MAVQEIFRLFFNDDIHRIEQPLQIALFDEGCPEIRHDEISDEQHTQVRHCDEHAIRGFSSSYGNKLNARSADVQLGGMVNGDVWFEGAYIIHVKALAEEVPGEVPRRSKFQRQLFVAIAPGVKTRGAIGKIGLKRSMVIQVGIVSMMVVGA